MPLSEQDAVRRRDLTVTRVFGELWHWKEQRIRNSSPFGRLEGWRLASFIVKAGDDLRQEQLAMQLIALLKEVFREEKLDLWLRPYEILCVGDQAGLIECVSDAKSIDMIKKRCGGMGQGWWSCHSRRAQPHPPVLQSTGFRQSARVF
jgi:phosphatidylinositol kinase/protein kinase (PI-3  family)